MKRMAVGVRWRLVAAVGIGLLLAASAARAAEAGDQDLKSTVLQLQQRVAQQDTRIAELEGRKSAAGGVTSEDVKKIVQEMNADASKNAGDFKIVWDNGVWFKSNDGAFSFHPGGRMYADWGWISGSGLTHDNANMGQTGKLHLRDGEEFRYLRLWGEGTMYKYVQYKVEVDFACDKVVLKDAFLRLNEIPLVGSFTVGHFKEPFSLEELTSDAAITFMEKSLGNIFVPSRDPGFMFSNAFLGEKKAERMTYAIGLFRQEAVGDTGVDDGTAVSSDRGYAMTARVTGLPYFADGGEKLIHLGLAYSIRGTNDDHSLRYRVRPEAHWVPYRFLDTGALANVDHVQLFGAEAAAVCGPFSLQSEYMGALLDFDSSHPSTSSSHDNTCYNAFYVQASYFLTSGDRRNYSTSAGAFAPVKPKKNFRQDGGWGAIELTTRYSYIDLDSQGLGSGTGGVGRGEMNDWTVGVNWYLNPNVRVMANYILAMPNRVDADDAASIYMMRFQLDF